MRFSKLTMMIALAALLLMSVPAFAGFTTFDNPGGPGCTTPDYCTSTTNYGGGDGSGNPLSGLGTFTFSSQMLQNQVGVSWGTWGVYPNVEQDALAMPFVLYSNGATSMSLFLAPGDNVAGFEYEPDQFLIENVSASFFDRNGFLIDTITRSVNGSGGALLFALTSTSDIGRIDISNDSGDDFSIAQLRQGHEGGGTTPEPGTMVLLGTGLLGALGVMRRKMNL